jgi:hypothetical protein
MTAGFVAPSGSGQQDISASYNAADPMMSNSLPSQAPTTGLIPLSTSSMAYQRNPPFIFPNSGNFEVGPVHFNHNPLPPLPPKVKNRGAIERQFIATESRPDFQKIMESLPLGTVESSTHDNTSDVTSYHYHQVNDRFTVWCQRYHAMDESLVWRRGSDLMGEFSTN